MADSALRESLTADLQRGMQLAVELGPGHGPAAERQLGEWLNAVAVKLERAGHAELAAFMTEPEALSPADPIKIFSPRVNADLRPSLVVERKLEKLQEIISTL